MLKVTRRIKEVDIILNQQVAEDIAHLGDVLAEETTHEQITEAGSDKAAKRTAERIEALRKQAEGETLRLKLQALGVSQWAQVLSANTVLEGALAGTRDMFGTAADAIPVMLVDATIGGRPVPDEDITRDALRRLFDELTDGQFSPLWEAIMDLNGRSADPKAAIDLASRILHD